LNRARRGQDLFIDKVKPTNLLAVRRGIENEPRDVALYLIRSMLAEPLMSVGANFGLNQYSAVRSTVIRVKKAAKG